MPWALPWAFPKHPRDQVNKAGREMLDIWYGRPSTLSGDQINSHFQIIDNWRTSHNYPLNVFQTGLRTRAKQVESRSLIAQRLKRFFSIMWKLERYPEMKLTQIQDIAGCRAILSSVPKVEELVQMYKRSEIKHKLVHEDDYIHNPRESGYRSHHLVYRYYSDKKSKQWNGLKIEIQIRSSLQHAWATAVETVGLFTRHALKSSHGDQDWLRFFALMGTAIAIRERTPPIPGTPANLRILKEELQDHVLRLDIKNRLAIFNDSLRTIEEVGVPEKGHYFLLELDVAAGRVKVTSYSQNDLANANKDYFNVEKRGSAESQDSVLVSVDSFKNLKRAYPNYFLDMRKFIDVVDRAIKPRVVPVRRAAPEQPGLFNGHSAT
jgi:hypothetical protein